MHSEFTNRQKYGGGGFAAFQSKDKQKDDELSRHTLTDKELLPIEQLTNVCVYIYFRSNFERFCVFEYIIFRLRCLWARDRQLVSIRFVKR